MRTSGRTRPRPSESVAAKRMSGRMERIGRAIAEGAGRRKERRADGGAASADHCAAQAASVLAAPGVAGFQRLGLGKLRFSFGE